MFLSLLTIIHVIISLTALVAGLVVLRGLLFRQPLDRWTAVFLSTTVLTSVTGFFFPVNQFMPSHAVGIFSLVVLALAIYAQYGRGLTGAWGKVYVISAVLALYLNVFVAIVQAFLKMPALKALAPTQTESPFKVTQLAVLVLFVAVGVLATIRFHTQSSRKTSFQ